MIDKNKKYKTIGEVAKILGLVNNKLCAINSNVGTRKGGSVDFPTVKKNSRMNQIIIENKILILNICSFNI